MNNLNFKDIIDYAIEREKAAVQFYQQLQAMAKFEAQKEALKEFEHMEVGHERKLKSIREKGPKQVSFSNPPELKSFEPHKDPFPNENMDFQDILIAGLKREENSYTLYKQLAEQISDKIMKDTFELLATEEANHHRFFQELYDEEVQPDN